MSAPASTPVGGDAGRALAEVPGLEALQHPGDVATRYAGALMGTYGTPQRVLVRGEGAWVWDDRGRRYLDLLAGIAVNALGHAHPVLTAAVTAQMATLGHVSNFFATGPQVALAERLLELLGAPSGSRVFLCSSGAEANEGAFKMARRTGRPTVLALEGGFHGRTMGALAMTAKQAIRAPFEPLPGGVRHLPHGDVDALEAALAGEAGRSVAALVVEPVQGEAGVRPLPEGYLARARALTAEAGALLVVDEVQTGIGRTGRWFASAGPDGRVDADVVTLAKGLGGGLPVGAVVGLGEGPGALLGAGQHGTTFGGNPVCAAAALAVLHVVERDGLVDRAASLGARWAADLASVDDPTGLLAGVRGEGLLLALRLARPEAPAVAAAALDAGFVVNAVAPDAVRLAPPLVLTDEQADSFTAALPGVLAAADAASSAPGATP
ncbi:acetylornithine transaminase [Pseudokineococcus lusitanus]|uniref:Acetylornithine aminotransferase n=1 Tax=Pseudokineococcus lusitanus TaxID=763993 RepID=A0A3N1HL21_9ACTN|nr:acetylornithine transaminase [Pseudokineococcus lusitanus]ROP43042.1 acetylornithine aminotransferase [Pseudokineococcus lusitanus]